MADEELKVHYDPNEDILWLAKPGVEEEFRELGDWINIEMDAEGEPLGIEIFHASKLLKRVAELIAENAKKTTDVPTVVYDEIPKAELEVTPRVDTIGQEQRRESE